MGERLTQRGSGHAAPVGYLPGGGPVGAVVAAVGQLTGE